MKRIFTLVLFLVSVQVIAQNYPITNTSISLSPNPDASLTKWGAGTLTVSASAKMNNGRIEPRVQDSKIVVIIKKGGSKICGAYNSNTAPSANFNTANKVWSGNNAVSLIGQDCTLPPGDYELCVQFFGPGPAGIMPLSEEKCRSFSIRNAEVQAYQPPQAISPANGTVLSEADFKKPITFRWTLVVPRPRESVTYRLKVWQLMQGQNVSQAIIQQPILGNDVGNLTQTTINNIQYAPCKPPYSCDFVWNVQALDRDGKPIGGNNGTSEANKITVQPVNDEPSLITLLTPKNGSVFSKNDQPKFTWNHDRQNPGPPSTYKIKIVEIKGNQLAEEAFRGNKPFFEKDSLRERNFQYPSSAPAFEDGKKYGWKIEAKRNPPYGEVKNTESGINEFVINTNNPVNAPVNGCPRQSVNWTTLAFELNKVSRCAVDQFACKSYADTVTKQTYYLIPGQFSQVYSVVVQNQLIADAKSWALNNRPIGCGGYKSIISITYSQSSQIYSGGKFSVLYGCCTGVNNQQHGIRLISPSNGGTLKSGDLPEFKWTLKNTGVPLNYKLRIVELKDNQSAEEALRTNKPFFEKDSIERLNFQYLSSAPNFEKGKKYAWNVQVLNREGKPIGDNNGTSETFTFNVTNSGCSHSATISSIECIGNINGIPQYKICVDYKNTAPLGCSNCTILLNSPNNYPGFGGGGKTIVSTNTNTIINAILPTVPTSLTAGQQTPICFNATVIPGDNLRFQIHATCNDASASLQETDRNHENSIFDTLPPTCTCTFCDQYKEWSFSEENITVNTDEPYNINIATTITNPNITIKSFKAELISFVHNGKQEECFGCNKDARTFGNLTGGTFGSWGTGFFPLAGNNTTHHTLNWFSASGATTTLSGSLINISISAPPFNILGCCDDEISFCIRYSFTDKECRTCSFVKCYTINRKHKSS